MDKERTAFYEWWSDYWPILSMTGRYPDKTPKFHHLYETKLEPSTTAVVGLKVSL